VKLKTAISGLGQLSDRPDQITRMKAGGMKLIIEAYAKKFLAPWHETLVELLGELKRIVNGGKTQ